MLCISALLPDSLTQYVDPTALHGQEDASQPSFQTLSTDENDLAAASFCDNYYTVADANNLFYGDMATDITSTVYGGVSACGDMTLPCYSEGYASSMTDPGNSAAADRAVMNGCVGEMDICELCGMYLPQESELCQKHKEVKCNLAFKSCML